MELIKVPNKKPGSYKYLYGPFIYNEVRRSNGKKFKCVESRAKNLCTATVTKNETGYFIEHNHPPPPLYEAQKEIESTADCLAAESKLSSSQIINLLKRK